jgi:hypothetical protein
MQVNHKDGNKANNRPENLEYVTAKENVAHAVCTGLRDTKGVKNAKSKLNEEKVRAIRQSMETGYALARKYGVTQRAICMVRHRLSWGHVQ